MIYEMSHTALSTIGLIGLTALILAASMCATAVVVRAIRDSLGL